MGTFVTQDTEHSKKSLKKVLCEARPVQTLLILPFRLSSLLLESQKIMAGLTRVCEVAALYRSHGLTNKS